MWHAKTAASVAAARISRYFGILFRLYESSQQSSVVGQQLPASVLWMQVSNPIP